MRTILLFLIALATAASFFAAEPRSPKPAAMSRLIIDNKGGTDFEPAAGRIVFHDKVQVFESEMYMECELLTVLQQTNNSGRAATGGSITNLSFRPDAIIAESNLMFMAQGTTIIGDRAVYTTSNETVVVTGDLVVIERSNVIFFSTNFVFNRLTSAGYALGWTATEIELGSGFSGTNGMRPGFGPSRKLTVPGQPKSTAPK